MALLSLIPIFGFAGILHLWSRRGLLHCLFCCIPMIIILLYIAGVAGFLYPASRILFFIGVSLFVLVFLKDLKGTAERSFLAEFKTPGIVFYLVGAFIVGICYRNSLLLEWDEFAHWGLATREMLHTGALLNGNSVTVLNGYPSGTNIFQLFVASNTVESDASFYFANYLLIFSAVMMFLVNASWHRIHVVLFELFGIITLIFCLGHDRNLYADHIPPVMFAAIVFVYYQSSEKDRWHIGLLPAFVCLPLIKQTGLFFALIAACLIIASETVSLVKFKICRDEKEEQLGPEKRINIGLLVILTVVMVCGPICSGRLIQWHNKRVSARGGFSLSDIESERVSAILTGKGNEREERISQKFLKYITSEPLSRMSKKRKLISLLGTKLSFLKVVEHSVGTLSTLGWAIICFCLLSGAIVAARTTDQRMTAGLILAAFLFSLPVYLLVHLLLYIFAFSTYEAEALASYSRYIASFFLGFGLLGFSMLAGRETSETGSRRRGIGLLLYLLPLLLLVGYIWIFETPACRKLFGPPGYETDTIRSLHSREVEKILNATTDNERIFIIYQGSNGFEFYILRYMLFPRRTDGLQCWSIGAPYSETDVWTNRITAQQWSLMLKDGAFDYVYVAHADDRFWSQFGSIFNRDRHSGDYLFRVTHDDQGQVTLIPVERGETKFNQVKTEGAGR